MNTGEYDFTARCVKLGVVTLTAGVVANFIPCMYLWLKYGVIPPPADIFKIWLVAASVHAISWFVQPISFFPLLGAAGSYCGWLSGSVADIKAPAASMAGEVSEYEPGTPQSDVVRTMMVCVSVITIFALAGGQIVSALPAGMKKAFVFMLPAIFGAVFMELSCKHLKVGLVTIAFAMVMSYVKMPGSVYTLITVFFGIFCANFFYNLEEKKKAAQAGTTNAT